MRYEVELLRTLTYSATVIVDDDGEGQDHATDKAIALGKQALAEIEAKTPPSVKDDDDNLIEFDELVSDEVDADEVSQADEEEEG